MFQVQAMEGSPIGESAGAHWKQRVIRTFALGTQHDGALSAHGLPMSSSSEGHVSMMPRKAQHAPS